MLRLMLLLTSTLLVISLKAQGTLLGTVTDEQGEPLPEASVFLKNFGKGITTDADGFFNFGRLSSGTYDLQVSYLGYQAWEKKVEVQGSTDIEVVLVAQSYGIEQVEVWGTWAAATTPVAQSNVSKEELEVQNLGQDMPYLLRWTPSVIVTSDAGAGIGYTGIRVRGSDATRTNVTINGIPLNDSESQGVFWVNMPDFASSVENIQIQRGVGTSTNGAGAFGATVNLSTIRQNSDPYINLDNTYGSFNTWKNTLRFGTGLINGQFTLDGRLSHVKSDGYIDRASSDLTSWYMAAGWYKEKTAIKAIAFSGKEKTYQAWYGVPEAKFRNDEAGLRDHFVRNQGSLYNTREDSINLFNSGRNYNYYLYDNQVDDYQQDHYQLHLTQQFSTNLSLKSALHYTHGSGFFEEYRYDDAFASYGLSDLIIGEETISSGNFVRRRWLDNDFYGGLAQLKYEDKAWTATFGSAYHYYDGDHFGEIIWAEFAGNSNIRDRYYQGTGRKQDFNIFGKATYVVSEQWSVFADLQLRAVNYTVDGTDNDLRSLSVDTDFTFFNPKVGLNFRPTNELRGYASFAVGNREPVRSDFVDAQPGQVPEHETLYDTEVGLEYSKEKISFGANLYWMQYKNQLVPTGELNDVGSSVRTNVPDSYRAGIELQMEWKLLSKLSWQWNTTLSQNKIKTFTDVVYDYTNGFEVISTRKEDTDIAFSPNVIVANRLVYQPLGGLTTILQSKYVGQQFLDNTGNEERVLDSYFVNDLLINYALPLKGLQSLTLTLGVYNLFDEVYASNGYTYSYIFGEEITENYYYPQVGTNFMLGVQLGF